MTRNPNLEHNLSPDSPKEAKSEYSESWLDGLKQRLGFRQSIERGGTDVIRFLDEEVAKREKGADNQQTFYIATKSEKGGTFTLLKLERVGDKIFQYTSPDKTKVFRITFREGVGVNQQFSAALPVGYQIYGISFPVTSQYAGSYKTNRPYSFVSYVPYEPLRDGIEKRKNGFEYLQSSFRQAHEKIKGANVPSQAFPGKKVHEVIPYWLPMLFNIVEHMDNDIYIGSLATHTLKPRAEVFKIMGDKMGETLNQYANNKRSAYNYSLSPGVGALGTAQMRKGPYTTLANEHYPSAKLNPDFIAGMQDHTNAMMAQILWFDDVLKTFPAGFKENYLLYIQGKPQKSDILGILGASYNKGTSISADLRNGKRWGDIFEGLPLESQIYFLKTRYVRQELEKHYGLKVPLSPNTAKVELEFQEDKKIISANRRTGKGKVGSDGKTPELKRERSEMQLRKSFQTYSDIADGIKSSKLILVPESGRGYILTEIGEYESDPSKKNLLRALDPPTLRLLQEIAGRFDMKFPGKKLPITSLARPQEYYDKIPSRGNHKAKDGKTSHMHGLAFDIGISRLTQDEQKWLNIELKGLKDKKVILTALEGKNAMHVFLRPVDNVKPQAH